MPQTISPRVEFLARAEWDTSGLPRLGFPVAGWVRTECIVHHTVSSDNDMTPTIWETLDEIKKHMRVLQQVRPDLGLDVPYNFVAFCRPGDTLTICEGRGFDRTGAHTHGHNTTGLATSFAANFEANPVPAIIPALNEWFGYMKGACPNLATFHGHRDFTGGSTGVGWTACPGSNMYALKPQWTFAKLEDDMALTQRQIDTLEAMAKLSIEPYTVTWPTGTQHIFPSKLDFLMAHATAFDQHRIVWIAGKA